MPGKPRPQTSARESRVPRCTSEWARRRPTRSWEFYSAIATWTANAIRITMPVASAVMMRALVLMAADHSQSTRPPEPGCT